MRQVERFGVKVVIMLFDSSPQRVRENGIIMREETVYKGSDSDGKFRASVGEILTDMIRKAEVLSDGTDRNRQD